MKKHIANIITGSRIVLSLPLLFIPLSSAWFYALYLLCGLSDMIDGTVARRTSSASEFGARLDMVSDFVFMSVALIKFVPHFHIPVAILIPYGEIADRAEKELPDKDQLILVYCRSGRRSKIAAEELVKLGYTNVKEFGGIIDWEYEIVK